MKRIFFWKLEKKSSKLWVKFVYIGLNHKLMCKGTVLAKIKIFSYFFFWKQLGRSLPIFFIFSLNERKVVQGKVTRLSKPKTKKRVNYKWFSFHTNRGSEILFLALIQIWPSSSLRDALHSSRVAVWLSKIIPFLAFQRTQHAVIKNSLKMWLLKSILAWMIMSSGWRLKFQRILIEFQQSELKGHSKKRWKQVSSGPLWHRTQL